MKNYLKKYGLGIAICLVVLTCPLVTFAQDDDLPCNGSDPYSSYCPLDTWVMFLAIIAVMFAAFHLVRKQNTHRI